MAREVGLEPLHLLLLELACQGTDRGDARPLQLALAVDARHLKLRSRLGLDSGGRSGSGLGWG